MVTENTTSVIRNIGGADAGANGKMFGFSADDFIGFYGTTPVIQPASGSQAAVVITAVTAMATTAATTGSHGYTTNTQADAIPLLLNQCVVDIGAMNILLTQIRTELVALGLISGAA